MAWTDFLNPVIEVLKVFLHKYNLDVPPNVTLVLMIVSLSITFLSMGVTYLFVDMDKLNKRMKEINEFNKIRKRAMDTADKKLWIEYKRREKDIQKLQMSMMMERTIPMFVLMVPFILLFNILRAVLGIPSSYGQIMAVWPFDFPDWLWPLGNWFHPYYKMPEVDAIFFGFWYFMVAIITSMILQRILGIPLPGMSVQVDKKQGSTK